MGGREVEEEEWTGRKRTIYGCALHVHDAARES